MLGKLFSGQPDYFHGADDAAWVLLVNFFVGRWVGRAQFFKQLRQRGVFQLGAKFGIGGWRFAESFEKCFEIKPRSAAENGRPPARLDIRNGPLRVPDKLGGIKSFVQIADIQQVVRHAGAFAGRGFGRADVESAIDLHGIDGDDFAADFFRERQRDGGFTRCRRAS